MRPSTLRDNPSIMKNDSGSGFAPACGPGRGLVLALAAAAGAALAQGDRPVYRCPGTPVLYTDAITPKEARDRAAAPWKVLR